MLELVPLLEYRARPRISLGSVTLEKGLRGTPAPRAYPGPMRTPEHVSCCLRTTPGSLQTLAALLPPSEWFQSEERKKDNLQLQIERVSASPRCHLAHETDGEEALREPVMTRR